VPETSVYDAVVVGGGHNGLVTGFYLARAGLSTVICERRGSVGGACVTEEFASGFRASTGAYVLSMLRESIWRDMRLVRRGIRVDTAGPSLNLYPDGAHMYLHDETAPNLDEISRFSKKDARAFPVFEEHLGKIAAAVTPVFDWTPPDPRARSLKELLHLTRYGRLMMKHRALMQDAAFLFTTSAAQYLGERFESEHVKSAIGWHAINDSLAGPSSSGTAYVLLHDHAAEEQAGGGVRQWGFVRGGMGQLADRMADAAREAGAEIRTDAEVDRILVQDGRATGVALAGGEVIRARRVVSNADPKRTFLGLLDTSDLPEWFLARSAPTAARERASRSTLGSASSRACVGLRARASSSTTWGSWRSTSPSRTWTATRRSRDRACPLPARTLRSASRRCTTPRSRPRANTWSRST
jgi:phytoene dehydrogenase-like protein